MNLSKRVSWFHWKWPKTEFKNQMEFLLEKTLQKLAHVHLVIVLQWFHQQQVCTLLPTVSAPWHFGKRHFGTDISSPGHFGPADVPTHGHFISMDISTQGLFGMGTFWHKEFSLTLFIELPFQYMAVLAQTFQHMCYCAEMSMYQNVSMPKRPLPKNPCAEKALYQKVLIPKRPQRWNVNVLQHLQDWNVHVLKYPDDEMSVPKCLWPKC